MTNEQDNTIYSTPRHKRVQPGQQPSTPRTPGFRILQPKGPQTRDRSAKRRRIRLELEEHLEDASDEEYDDKVLDLTQALPAPPALKLNSLTSIAEEEEEQEQEREANRMDEKEAIREMGMPVNLSKELSNAMPAPISPVKRGRGRPRKYPLAKPVPGKTTRDVSRGGTISTTTSIDNAQSGSGFEEYFEKLSSKKTSSNTLSQLPVLENEVYLNLVKRIHEENAEKTQTLIYYQCQNFNQWYCELVYGGFNLLFYGFGSKELLLSQFVEAKLAAQYPVFVVKGYFPSLQLRSLLTGILELLDSPPTVSAQDMVQRIVDVMNDPQRTYEKLVLLIHNIDGEELVDERCQTSFATLAMCPNIYLIASVDHVNFPLLWDSALESQLNFVMHDATTFARYYNETTYENSLGIGRAGNTNKEKAIKHVLSSLPSNSRAIFKLLLIEQLERMVDLSPAECKLGERVGVEYRLFFHKCSSEFLCSNEMNFRSQLTEFFDHDIISSKHDASNLEYLWIPHPKELLETLLEGLMESV
ncbi:origin recognition complex subunit Orc2 [Schizosaccharomyces japonicus yFS275]|uniref:Origin recognition complex subunit 2 n=1 Tax=Schizosaccharomyces japonicus (strain yFS275 / FY16936) TaxID=402676 RepID=B6K177_SCHJY|nr:origin recognition complex subunit Orc2 [Schizosaccharomyces japonicus yFS275]EEB07698.1 origin recognition complex subunit Orc2 [Schizosaccharomyces japonicus yFS275]